MARDTAIPVFDYSGESNVGRMPAWVRGSLSSGAGYGTTARAVHGNDLHTVCEAARCPNRGECWSRKTASFMLLGDICTRACGFCSVATGRPAAADPDEPRRVAEAVAAMGLDYVVLTSVNRDDLADGGAGIFAATLQALRAVNPGIGLEVLTPDFRKCQAEALAVIAAAVADTALVFGHNMETVPRLYPQARKGARYERSLALLEQAAARPGFAAKSALMLGLGERADELSTVLRDLRSAGVTRLALGQYLRPTRHHLPVREYVTPERFAELEAEAQELGFEWVKAGPMVRSSWHAEEA